MIGFQQVAEGIGATAAIFTVAAFGAGAGRRFRDWRATKKAGPQADHDLLHKLNEDFRIAMDGRKPSVAEPHPPPGVNKRLQTLEERQDHVISILTPNGGESSEPGDMLQKVFKQNAAIMERIGIDPDVVPPPIVND